MLLTTTTMVRSATEQDLMIVASWINSANDCEWWAGNALSYPLRLETLSRDILMSPDNAYCLIDQHLLAFGQILDKGNGRIHLAKIIVAPDKRGAGVGSIFITELLKLAKQKSFSVVGLNVQPDNEIAIKLYTKLGFDFTERPANVTPASTSLYMSRHL